MGWIDCKKAYDTAPHSWIIQSMELHKIDHKIINAVQQSMRSWNTALTSGGKHLANIKIKQRIFQGDALLPLLCGAINPLSYILRDAKQRYTLKTGHKINHLLFMDDLKLYAKNEKDLTALMETVRIVTTDICMEFGLEKCTRQIIHRGNIKITDELNLDIGEIRDPDIETGYKYLGILQNMQNKQRGQTQSNDKLQKKLKADSQITPQCQKQNTGLEHKRNVSDHLHSRNHRLEQERNTGSRQNDKEDNEHVRRTSPKSRHSQVVPSKKRRRQRVERSCSNSQIPMCRITGIHQQGKRKRSSDRSSLETSSNQRIQKEKGNMEEWEIEKTTK